MSIFCERNRTRWRLISEIGRNRSGYIGSCVIWQHIPNDLKIYPQLSEWCTFKVFGERPYQMWQMWFLPQAFFPDIIRVGYSTWLTKYILVLYSTSLYKNQKWLKKSVPLLVAHHYSCDVKLDLEKVIGCVMSIKVIYITCISHWWYYLNYFFPKPSI